jgi:UDP-N-acetylmuramoyl-tripeptide--D-alanyl-D-alanine ligase
VLSADGGNVLLIDESYNANPASVRAALAAMGMTLREDYPRRVAVLGDMLELGEAKADLHRALKEAVDAAGVDLVLACGPMMRLLLDDLDAAKQGAWAETSAGLVDPLLSAVKAGDVVMIKGSLGSRMAPLVEALLSRFAGGRAGG